MILHHISVLWHQLPFVRMLSGMSCGMMGEEMEGEMLDRNEGLLGWTLELHICSSLSALGKAIHRSCGRQNVAFTSDFPFRVI